MDTKLADQMQGQNRFLIVLIYLGGLLTLALIVVLLVLALGNRPGTAPHDPGKNPDDSGGPGSPLWPAGAGKKVVAKPWQPKSDLFKTVKALDGTFSLKIPKDWTVKSALFESLSVWSPKGEHGFAHTFNVPADKESYRKKLQGLQLLGKFPSPPEKEMLVRTISPLLSPAEVVTTYLPKLNAPLVANMQILKMENPSPEMQPVLDHMGGQAKIIHYRYTFKGKEGPEWLLALFPEVLKSKIQVTMEGSALVITAPTPFAGVFPGFNFWGLTVKGWEAPTTLFGKNRPLYDFIDGTFQYDFNAVQKKVTANLDLIKNIGNTFLKSQHETQKTSRALGEYANYILGDRLPYYSEKENRIYTIGLGENGGEVVSPSGEVLRPATLEDFRKTYPPMPGE